MQRSSLALDHGDRQRPHFQQPTGRYLAARMPIERPALARNLLAGLRLFAFLPVQPWHFAPSARQVVLLAAIALAAWIGLDRLWFGAGVEIWWFSVQQVVAVGALAIALLLLLAPQSAAAERSAASATAVAAALPFVVLLGVLLDSVAREPWRFAIWLVPVMSAVVLYRAQRLFLGFAGYGKQRVFDKEVRFAQRALAERVDLERRSALLINAPEPDDQTPFATVSGLRRTLAGVGRRMNPDEDFLVLFLTSHGGENAELSVAQDELPLDDLRGAELRQALDDADIRWRIVVISACHSASFIPHLEDPRTLVATASRADRRSLGCSDERELTYFGEALFRDALPKSDDLIGALALAREVVERHEREEKVAESERSEPQVFIGARMREKLAELKFRPAG